MRKGFKWALGGGLGFGLLLAGGTGTGGPGTTPKGPEPAVLLSQTGRDRAFTQGVREARVSLYVRAASLNSVPMTNELMQAAQRGVAVHLELPLFNVQSHQREFELMEALAKVGAWIELGTRPMAAYEGAYILQDEAIFFYSAAPLDPSEPGIPHSYVRGLVSKR